MRILYFSRDYTTHDRRFLIKLAQSRNDVRFLRLENDGIPYEKRPLPKGVRPLQWAAGRNKVNSAAECFQLMPAFEKAAAKLNPDLIHAGPVQTCGFMTALLNFHPFVLMSWGSDILVDADKDGLSRRATRFTLRQADRFVCDADAVRRKAQSIAAVPDKKIIQFPWGVDLKTFRPGDAGNRIRRALGWENQFIVLSTRAWDKIYGTLTLLEAFRLAHRQEPRLRLLLLATGPLKKEVQRFIVAHSLSKSVHCPGQVPAEKVPAYHQAADVYISCAASDGTSVSLLEALATGTPAVATAIPSNREWIKPGVNGWLGGAGDAKSFSKALLMAARQTPAKKLKMSQRNRSLAERRADWDANIAKLLSAYKSLRKSGRS